MTGPRVLIDALAARYGGAAYAAINVARHLARRPETAAVTVLARHDSIIERGLRSDTAVERLALAPAERLELARRTAWEALRLPQLMGAERFDVLISMSGMLPREHDWRLICLISNPVMYERATLSNRVRRWAVRRTARECTELVAPSRTMAELVSASARRPCAVIPWGVDHDVFSPAPGVGTEVLCVADFYAHKRHDLLLEAWLRLPAPRPRLRLVGNPAVDPRAHARLRARIEALPDASSIVLEHRVPLARLVAAYRAARVFAMPSERESFCMPLAESMACGVPAVARGTPSLRETGGAGARYVHGDDPDQWAAALRALLEDSDEHARARELALRAASRFTWEGFAAELAARL